MAKALFDQANHLVEHYKNSPDFINKHSHEIQTEFKYCASFLLCYQGSSDTFKAYRREVERLFQWCLSAKTPKVISKLTREDIQEYIEFIKQPPSSWCSEHHKPRFFGDTLRTQNPEWKPFVAKNKKPRLSNSALSSMLAILSTFYTYLQQEQISEINPIRLLRQKKRLIQQSQQQSRVTRKLSKLQWQTVIECTQEICKNDAKYERSLFILSILYLLSLRISEIAPNELHIPIMGDFIIDDYGCWWFKTIGKGNKYREIAVPDALLTALKRYRNSLNLPDLPHKNENTPLIGKLTGYGGVGIRQIRALVQECFDQAIVSLKSIGLEHEAKDLSVATVHWLRHTAITADVQNRPIEHVRDDAGHNNTSITDRYIDSDQKARHESARHKVLLEE